MHIIGWISEQYWLRKLPIIFVNLVNIFQYRYLNIRKRKIIKKIKEKKDNKLLYMSISPTFGETHYPYCLVELIRKIVLYELRNLENYLKGLIIITTCICLRCQITIQQEAKDFLFFKSKELAHHHNLGIAIFRYLFNSMLLVDESVLNLVVPMHSYIYYIFNV